MQRTKAKKNEETPVVRTMTAPLPGQIKWINNGGAFYNKNGKRILHGATFMAAPDEVPTAFHDVIKPVDPSAVVVEQPIKAVKPNFSLQRRGSTEFVDVLDSGGKRVNEKDLTAQEAKQVLEMLV